VGEPGLLRDDVRVVAGDGDLQPPVAGALDRQDGHYEGHSTVGVPRPDPGSPVPARMSVEDLDSLGPVGTAAVAVDGEVHIEPKALPQPCRALVEDTVQPSRLLGGRPEGLVVEMR